MGVDIIHQKYHKGPKIYLSKLSAQAQKYGISMKKGLHWASIFYSILVFYQMIWILSVFFGQQMQDLLKKMADSS